MNEERKKLRRLSRQESLEIINGMERQMKLNLRDVRQELAALTPAIRVSAGIDGEYRVSYRDVVKDEPTAYYTNDLEDALLTGRRMSAQGQS